MSLEDDDTSTSEYSDDTDIMDDESIDEEPTQVSSKLAPIKLNILEDDEGDVDVEEEDDEYDGLGEEGEDGNEDDEDDGINDGDKVLKEEDIYSAQFGGENNKSTYSDDEDDEDDIDETYLQKLNVNVNKNYLTDFHPECLINNYDEIAALSRVVRDKHNNIIDDLHKTIPYLTKYERARVLGQRAKQINSGAKAFVKVPDSVIDGYLIAELEIMQKRLPFIIRRPIPGGGCEYWNLKDLEIVGF